MPTRVLCLGNDLMGDDAVGPAVARCLRRLRLPGVEVVESAESGLRLMDYLDTPRLIVVDEKIFAYLPRARFTLAEEVAHLILEYGLWKGGKLPVGSNSHELSEAQHFFVEKDAKSLASALLLPATIFSEVFTVKRHELDATGAPALNVLRETIKHAADGPW